MATANVKEVLSDLISFRTVSSESNIDCVTYIKEYLEGCGATSWLQADATGKKLNYLATIGPNIPGGILLSGHTDVVPTDGQVWESDPWTAIERNGRVYGRGATDMKGFLASMLVTAKLASEKSLSRPIHLAFSYDEEVGCLGAWPLCALIKERLPDLPPIIVGEPTCGKVVTSHKGIATFITTVNGHSVHSSRVPEGVSAVTEGARLVAWLDDLMHLQAAKERSSTFDPPFTTIHCGMISGGAAVNVVAADCTFTTDVRSIEGKDPREYQGVFERHIHQNVLPRIRRVHPDVSVIVTPRSYTPGFDPEASNQAEIVARQITGDNETRSVSYATEAGVFQKNGFSAVVCGPGDIAQAHQANEFIEVSELEGSTSMLERLVGLRCI